MTSRDSVSARSPDDRPTKAPAAAFLWDADGDEFVFGSEALAALFGQPDGSGREFGSTAARLERQIHPDDLPAYRRVVGPARAAGGSYEAIFRAMVAGVGYRHFRETGGPAGTWSEGLRLIAGTLELSAAPQAGNDIDPQVGEPTDLAPSGEAKLSREQLTAAIQALPAGFCLYDADDRLVLCNRRYREVYPRHADALVLGRKFEDMLRAGVERGEFCEAVGREEAWIAERVRRHRNPEGPIEQMLADGRWLRIEERRTPDGEIIGLRTDITDLKHLQQALKANEELFRDFTAASADWVWEMNADLRFTYLSENFDRIIGVPGEWHYGKSREDLLGDDYDREAWADHLETLRRHEPFRNFEYLRFGGGVEPRWLRISGIPKFDEDGRFTGYRGTGSDITEWKRAEERLHASEIKLLHAQKTESIGRLTGGIAHDFNNLLAVIQGNLELVEERLPDPQTKLMVRAALKSVARGAELTGQLLMFGRRAVLTPAVIDLNRNVGAMEEMIRRTVPATIAIDTQLADDLWPVKLDQGQLEAAILNLVLNAKDAMPEGGRLTVRTRNIELAERDLARFSEAVQPGRYVMLETTDTGHGMDADTMAHAFDPFFTTKEVGQGSGLGLSMVQGFVQHSGGDVLIDSEPGRGTTVRLYFPACAEGHASALARVPDRVPRAVPGDCVLVVEDEAEVRKVVAAQLAGLGYEVLQAADGASGLSALRSDRRIDVLLTDVVMPGNPQGPALAEEACALRPGIGVILMTGYPSKAAADNVLGSLRHLCLSKPISKAELAREVWKQIHDRSAQ